MIIKELAEGFKNRFTCLRENNKKYITFTVPIEVEVTRIGKNGEEIENNIYYTLYFIDSAGFISTSLSNPVSTPSEVIHRIG